MSVKLCGCQVVLLHPMYSCMCSMNYMFICTFGLSGWVVGTLLFEEAFSFPPQLCFPHPAKSLALSLRTRATDQTRITQISPRCIKKSVCDVLQFSRLVLLLCKHNMFI